MNKNVIITVLAILVVALGGYAIWQKKQVPSNPQNTIVIQSEAEEKSDKGIAQSLYQTVAEWGLKYAVVPANARFSYSFQPRRGAEDAGYLSSIDFAYNPPAGTDAKWASCPLPSVLQWQNDPSESLMPAMVSGNVRKIAGRYYVYDATVHEPCWASGEMISGAAIDAWNARRQEVRKIFESLQPI